MFATNWGDDGEALNRLDFYVSRAATAITQLSRGVLIATRRRPGDSSSETLPVSNSVVVARLP